MKVFLIPPLVRNLLDDTQSLCTEALVLLELVMNKWE